MPELGIAVSESEQDHEQAENNKISSLSDCD
jgi:hypothetical protein